MYALVNGLSSDRSIDSAWKIYSKRFIFFFSFSFSFITRFYIILEIEL